MRSLREPLLPPAHTEEVSARRALVLAPHYDDEVLGCGGLLAKLRCAGTEVRVLFLSDGAGGSEGADDPQAYARRRRGESEAVASVLELAGIDHLGLPDGLLEEHGAALLAGIRRVLASQKPDLLLAPSPLEVTRDHRAAFAALYELLTALRGDDELGVALGGTQVLLYEVNHPGYPDLLVDVSDQLGVLERAMRLYASQQERHDYLGAALGLRRYRTHSLTAGVAGAEAYRRLVLSDFTTRSAAQLITHLGGQPTLLEVTEGPLVSVIVRTRDRPELLRAALDSLAAGSFRRVEVVLVNDGGAPVEPPAQYPFTVKRVDLPENRGRAEAANAGVAAAAGAYVAFLDDDDLAAPEHLQILVGAVVAEDVKVAYTDAAVAIYELGPNGWVDVERRLPYSRDFDPEILLLDNYIPFNTVLIERSLFERARDPGCGKPFDPALEFFEDWDFLIRLAAVVRFHHLPRVTCEYRHFRGAGHHVLGGGAGDNARDFLATKARVLEKHRGRLGPATLASAVTRLRREIVELKEALATRSRELDAERRELDAERRSRRHFETEYQRLNGEVTLLRPDLERHRATVADQGLHLERTYGEIERLGRLIAEMEQTRAWRWHRRLEHLRGAGS